MSELDALVGEWTLRMIMPDGSMPESRASTRFEWVLDGAFLLQTSSVDFPGAPDGHMLMTEDRQYYFDSRGVIRQYEMSLTGGEWTLARLHDDDFRQRFRATIGADRIEGRWEIDEDGDWRHDFDLEFTRVR